MKKIGLPNWALNLAYKFVDVEKNSPVVDERTYEYAYAASRIARWGEGTKLLDVGCVARTNFIPQLSCELGFESWGIDVRPYSLDNWKFRFIQGSILDYSILDSEYFTIVTAISTLEHIGVGGRYGIQTNIRDGDVAALSNIKRVLVKDGRLILTVPYSHDSRGGKISSLGRTYTYDTLEKLRREWKIIDKRTQGNIAMMELAKKE